MAKPINWRTWLLDLLFPRRCVGCGRRGDFLCPTCRSGLPYLRPPYCARCGRPLAQGRLCPRCRQTPLRIDGVRAVCVYSGSARAAIHQLKYRQVWGLADVLGELLYAYWQDHPVPGGLLVPVPLHPDRERRRGYNQSRLLADSLGRRAGLPVADGVLTRRRDTPSQVDMADLPARWRNVQGAFTCPAGAFAGERVLLVDDVSTTGATLEACALTLGAAGAETVWGLVVARATGT